MTASVRRRYKPLTDPTQSKNIIIIFKKSNDLSDTITRQQLRGHLTKKAQIMLHVSCWQFNCQSAETEPDFRQPNEWRKRWDLVSHEEAALVCSGRLFHARAAATGQNGLQIQITMLDESLGSI